MNGTTRPDRGGGGDRGGGNVQNEGGRGARGSKGQSQRCGRLPVCLFENPILGTDVCRSFAGVIVCRVPASLLVAPPFGIVQRTHRALSKQRVRTGVL